MGNNVELSLFLLYCCVSNESAAEAYSVIVQPIQLQTIRTFLCELFYNIHSYQCMLFLFFQLFHPRSHIKQAQVLHSPLTGLWRHFSLLLFPCTSKLSNVLFTYLTEMPMHHKKCKSIWYQVCLSYLANYLLFTITYFNEPMAQCHFLKVGHTAMVSLSRSLCFISFFWCRYILCPKACISLSQLRCQYSSRTADEPVDKGKIVSNHAFDKTIRFFVHRCLREVKNSMISSILI